MANIERGEVDMTITRIVDGQPVEKVYTLKLSMNAAVALEARTKRKLGELMADAAALDFTAIRDLVYVLLQKHHAKEINSLTAAGEFIDDAGGVDAVSTSLNSLVEANASESGGAANPPAAPGGTGGGSTATPGVSA
jgi:hypothetical protein